MSLFCQVSSEFKTNPAGNYMFKVNKKKTLEQKVKYVEKRRLASLLLTLNIFHTLL